MTGLVLIMVRRSHRMETAPNTPEANPTNPGRTRLSTTIHQAGNHHVA